MEGVISHAQSTATAKKIAILRAILFERNNVNDHRAATSDSPLQNARTSPLRVHRIVIRRLAQVDRLPDVWFLLRSPLFYAIGSQCTRRSCRPMSEKISKNRIGRRDVHEALCKDRPYRSVTVVWRCCALPLSGAIASCSVAQMFEPFLRWIALSFRSQNEGKPFLPQCQRLCSPDN